jgi:phosphopantetheinyl transferase (holo-ACP synthase)
VSDICGLGLDVEDAVGADRSGFALDRWTATEAALKAMGLGLRELHAVRLDDDLAGAQLREIRLHLRRVALAEGCVAWLASPRAVSVVTVEEVGRPL